MGDSCCGSEWRSAYAPTEVIQRVRPKYNPEYILNPHKGTTTFQRFEGDPIYPGLDWSDVNGPMAFPPRRPGKLVNDRYPATTIAYCRWPWGWLEPEQGKIRYDIIDGALAAATERGQSLQIRSQPWVGGPTWPAWHLEHGGILLNPKQLDCNSDAYLRDFGNHIRLLGERYDGHPNLESIDIGYGGACGEGGGNSTAETARKLVDIFVRSFKKTQLVSMLGTLGCTYAATLKDRRIGWRADCLGDVRTDGKGQVPTGLNWNHMLDAYPKTLWTCGVVDAWKTAPITWETCWTVGYWHVQKWDIDWILDQALKYHPSIFMPKSVYVPDEWMGKINEFNKRLGYRFFLHQMILPLEAKRGQTIDVEATIDNKGVAPIYRPYHFALRFSQGKEQHVVRLKQDIRKWLPDLNWFREPITFPTGLLDGPCEICCGIVDDTDTPRVKLAIKGLTADGWHPLTYLDILK